MSAGLSNCPTGVIVAVHLAAGVVSILFWRRGGRAAGDQ
jgi:hypothetical protein